MNVDHLPSGNETVLVVDDDATVRRLAVKILERLGYRVLQAQDPDHALRIAMNAYVDVILMDVVLPQMDGLSLARTIGAVRPKTRLLFTSGYGADELPGGLEIPDPETGFLPKPFGPDELAVAIRQILDRAPGAPPPTPVSSEGEDGKTVLLVDDDDDLRRALVRVLEREGYRVLEAPAPRLALDLARTHPGPIHLLVCDVVLPMASGLSLAHGLARLRPGIPTLFISGYTGPEALEGERLQLGDGVDFLQKPFELDDFRARAAALLGEAGGAS
jgi:DNA-binding response OmpR family regulator